jgi:predicted kinase
MKAIITIGVSSSGKTTWAEEQEGFAVISRDDVRRHILETEGKLLRHENMWSKWNFKREKEVTELYWKHVEDMYRVGNNIILADTNLNPQRRQEMQKRLESLGYEVECRQFDVTFEEAVKRDKTRKDTVGHDIIWKQYLELYGEKYEPDLALPKAILVDIDGTLGHMDGKRGPFEWSKVEQDRCDEVVKQIVDGFAGTHEVILLSGRDSVCRSETLRWLDYNDVYYDNLYMRSEGDMRKDSIIKRELFDNHIRDKYNVVCVIDDRPQVIRQWMLMGLKVINVGDPYKEF